jgi:hypothetical protein
MTEIERLLNGRLKMEPGTLYGVLTVPNQAADPGADWDIST